MGELTENIPKPMLEVLGKTLMEHKFDALPPEVDEVIIIVGYLGGVIHGRFGGEYNGKRLLYIEQDVLDGTAGALWRARDILHDRFLVMMGDDIYSREDIEMCLASEAKWCMLVADTDSMRGGAVVLDEKNIITGIVEGGSGKGCVGTNLFTLDTDIFDYPAVPRSEGSVELGLPQTVVAASRASGIPFIGIRAKGWIQITAPEDLTKAEDILRATSS